MVVDKQARFEKKWFWLSRYGQYLKVLSQGLSLADKFHERHLQK